MTGGWNPKFNPELLKYTEVAEQLGISEQMLPRKFPVAWEILELKQFQRGAEKLLRRHAKN